MKHVVLKYVENLVAWADSLFRRDTMETVHQALQLYVMAGHVLGPRPEVVPKRGEVAPQSFETLRPWLDDFSNALVQMENAFPYASAVGDEVESPGSSLLGLGQALYFCVPANDKMLAHWDTVADRLYKIRHCQNIDGVERHLALFAPPIDPGALVAAAANGLSLGDVLAALSSPAPIYRFSFLIQRANEFCADVKSLGSALLSAITKRDDEALSLLRASHEKQLLGLMTAVRERQVLDAKARREGLLKSREAAILRLQHHLGLLGNDGVTVPAEPSVDATLTADSALPMDTAIATVEVDVDASLVDGDEAGVKLIPREKAEFDKSNLALVFQQAAASMEKLAGQMNFIPTFGVSVTPFGVGVSVSFGGSNIAGGLSSMAKDPQILAAMQTHEAVTSAKMATYVRRDQEWTFQANLAAREVVQIDKQITSADIQIQVAQKELEHHIQEAANAEEVWTFLQDKFTRQELYQWMREQLFGLYKQSYNLAYDLAKKAEQAYRYELGRASSAFVQYGYWENAREGLVSGERLQLALRQLEHAYLGDNRRELELTKHISLAAIAPDALLQLRETGRCSFSVPEEIFDLDFRGHYFRRIKSVRLTIPCVTGPYTSLGCSLRLLGHSVRTSTAMNGANEYERENDEGIPLDDVRFRTSHVPVTAIATGAAQGDSGLFELNFRDERYLPFEGAGAISTWQVELSTDAALRSFDYSTITTVLLHVDYTAREEGGLFKDKATQHLKRWVQNAADVATQPFAQILSLRHEFPSEWHRLFHPAVAGGDQRLDLVVGNDRFPFFARDRRVAVTAIEVFARGRTPGAYRLTLSYTDDGGNVVTSTEITAAASAIYGDVRLAVIGTNDAGLDLASLDVASPMTLKVRHATAADYVSLAAEDMEDIILLVRYKLE